MSLETFSRTQSLKPKMATRRLGGGREEGRKEGRKEGRRKGGRKGEREERREGGRKEGRKERKEGRKEGEKEERRKGGRKGIRNVREGGATCGPRVFGRCLPSAYEFRASLFCACFFQSSFSLSLSLSLHYHYTITILHRPLSSYYLPGTSNAANLSAEPLADLPQ